MSLNTPAQTFSNAENFVETILQDAKKFNQEIFANFEYTKEERDFLIAQVEKYNNGKMGLTEMQAIIDDLVAQDFDEKRWDILANLIADRFMFAINGGQIQQVTINIQNNVNELL